MKNIKGGTWFHESAVCIGAYKAENDLIVIDTGNDDSSARKAVRSFESINVKYVFNTHSHADHCGGNSYFSRKYNSVIIAPEIENSFINYPVLEPVYLYGAAPPSAMINKFLCAPPSFPGIVISNDKDITLNLGSESFCFKLIPLKGHSPNMHGIITPDNIAFLGDALLGFDLVNKHGLIFSFNVKEHLESLKYLETLDTDGYVLAHGGFVPDITALIECNRKSLEDVLSAVLDFTASGSVTLDDIHSHLFEKYELRENLSLNVLNRSIIKAHVQYLNESGYAVLETENGRTVVSKKA